MVLELALLRIKAGEEVAFESAFRQAAEIIAEARGYIAHQLQRCVEIPDQYALLVKWESVEDHMVGFRESPLCPRWRALLAPFYQSPPTMQHYQLVIES